MFRSIRIYCLLCGHNPRDRNVEIWRREFTGYWLNLLNNTDLFLKMHTNVDQEPFNKETILQGNSYPPATLYFAHDYELSSTDSDVPARITLKRPPKRKKIRPWLRKILQEEDCELVVNTWASMFHQPLNDLMFYNHRLVILQPDVEKESIMMIFEEQPADDSRAVRLCNALYEWAHWNELRGRTRGHEAYKALSKASPMQNAEIQYMKEYIEQLRKSHNEFTGKLYTLHSQSLRQQEIFHEQRYRELQEQEQILLQRKCALTNLLKKRQH